MTLGPGHLTSRGVHTANSYPLGRAPCPAPGRPSSSRRSSWSGSPSLRSGSSTYADSTRADDERETELHRLRSTGRLPIAATRPGSSTAGYARTANVDTASADSAGNDDSGDGYATSSGCRRLRRLRPEPATDRPSLSAGFVRELRSGRYGAAAPASDVGRRENRSSAVGAVGRSTRRRLCAPACPSAEPGAG